MFLHLPFSRLGLLGLLSFAIFAARAQAPLTPEQLRCWQHLDLPAELSNFGRQTVDLFAPGVDIYSSTPANKYATYSGTSMAGPVVAGVAAVLRSYFPQLTAAQLQQVMLQSAVPYHTKVLRPGTKKPVDFATISRTGGMVNLYEAVKLAQQMTAAR